MKKLISLLIFVALSTGCMDDKVKIHIYNRSTSTAWIAYADGDDIGFVKHGAEEAFSVRNEVAITATMTGLPGATHVVCNTVTHDGLDWYIP